MAAFSALLGALLAISNYYHIRQPPPPLFEFQMGETNNQSHLLQKWNRPTTGDDKLHRSRERGQKIAHIRPNIEVTIHLFHTKFWTKDLEFIDNCLFQTKIENIFKWSLTMLDCWSIAILLMSAARVRKRGNEEVKFSHQGFPLWRPLTSFSSSGISTY